MSVVSKDSGLWFFEGKMRNLNMEKLCYGLFIWLYLKKMVYDEWERAS